MKLGYQGVTHTIVSTSTEPIHGTERLHTACGTWFAERVAIYFPETPECAECAKHEEK